MIEEEVISGDDDTSHEFQAETLPVVVRSEMNFLRLPFFSLSRDSKKNEEMVYEFTEVRDGQRVTFSLSIIPSVRYGRPTAFDRRVARAVDVIVDEAYIQNGLQLVNPIEFSIYRLVELIGLSPRKGRSGWLYEDIRTSLKRITATTMESERSFYLKDKEQWSGGVFHLYSRYVFKGERRYDTGEIAETNCLWLGDEYLNNINARYVRPLDYQFLRSLKNDMAAREYEVLSPKFYGLDKRLPYYQVDYQDFCKTLPITPQRYYSYTQRQFKRAHEELGGWEYISKVGYVLHKGSQKVKTLRFYPGERAKRERNGELLRRAKYLHVEEQLLLPLSGKETKTIELKGLAKELHERGVRPEAKCEKLAEGYPEERINEKIELFELGVIETAGGLVAAIEDDWQPTKAQLKTKKTAARQQVEEQVRELKLEKERIKKPYEEECEGIFEKISAEHTEVVNEAMEEVVKANPIIIDTYDKSKPYAEQSIWVQGGTRPRLRKKFPDMFKAVDDEYQSQIGKIDEQIDELRKETK